MRRTSGGCGGGFALHEAFLRRVAGVSNPRVVQFPPIGDGEAAVCGGVAAKVQTHWARIAENGMFWLNGSAISRHRSLSWCVVRASPPEHAPQPLVSHSPACKSINRLTSCELSYMTVLSSNEAKSGRD